ncbi:hypothetical protein GCK32_016153 [Trichostrongylus colubriformis]|uniref:Uncharacterized protein n=1 Tax=Trichostrongylus colubriformis TaxID=6319 RepID=A0AAN8IXY8_TRICO
MRCSPGLADLPVTYGNGLVRFQWNEFVHMKLYRKSLSSDQLDDVDGVEDEPDSNIQEKMRQLRMEYDSTVPYE